MFLKKRPFCPIKFCLILICLIVFSQNEIYRSDLQSEKLLGSLLLASNRITTNNSHNLPQINNTPTITLNQKQLWALGKRE
jgi:hypothetical protein